MRSGHNKIGPTCHSILFAVWLSKIIIDSSIILTRNIGICTNTVCPSRI